MNLFDLHDDVIGLVLKEWLDLDSMVALDRALTQKGLRSGYLRLLRFISPLINKVDSSDDDVDDDNAYDMQLGYKLVSSQSDFGVFRKYDFRSAK